MTLDPADPRAVVSTERMRESLPLTGVRLWRWKLALIFYRFGCRLSGRHEALIEYDEVWKIRYCPHCGWLPDEDER